MSKNPFNLLLINPSPMPLTEMEPFLNRTSIARVPGFSMPVGLIEMSAWLRKEVHGINIYILDLAKDLYALYRETGFTPRSADSFFESMLDKCPFVPDLIGMSIEYSTAHKSSLRIVNLAQHRWRAPVVCGGNHATNYYRFLLEHPGIDAVVRGEGEIALGQLVSLLANGTPIGECRIQGVVVRPGVDSDEVSPMINNLDDIPLPAYDLLDLPF